MPHECNSLPFSLEINRVYFSKSVRRPEVLKCTVLSRASTSNLASRRSRSWKLLHNHNMKRAAEESKSSLTSQETKFAQNMKPLYKNVLYVDPLVVTHHRKLTAFILQMATMAQLGTQNIVYETSRDPFETLEMISRNKYDLIFVVDDQQNLINGITLGNLIKEITEKDCPLLVLIHSSHVSEDQLNPFLSSSPSHSFDRELYEPSLFDLVNTVDGLLVNPSEREACSLHSVDTGSI